MINKLTRGLRFYQSANADAGTIKEDFIIRLEEYGVIMDDVRRGHMKGSVQHYLLLGRRGSGKSTLMKRIQVEIDEDSKLKQRYVAINPAEEQANIYRLADLLETIIDELEDKDIDIVRPEAGDDDNEHNSNLFAVIHQAIEQSGKKIVLLLDNIDRIFDNLRDDRQMLREILLNYDDIKIIGGSTRMTEHFWSYDQPFYEFFRVLELKPLATGEIKTLLLGWSEKLQLPELKKFVEERPGQLETVRLLTDGLPRTLQFFVNILINNTQETGYEYLRQIMDVVTPLYQERLNGLPAAQRKITLQMAFIWEAAGTKEISEATLMDNKLISAQLGQLAEKGIVEKILTGNKNHLYRLSERFFNLWLIFTQGSPKEKRKAKCLTIFLENFYDGDGLRRLAEEHLKLLSDGKLVPNKAALITKALAQSRHISSVTRDELIDKTLLLGSIDENLKKQLPETLGNITKKIIKLINEKKWTKAIELAESIEQDDGAKDYIIGSVYRASENYDQAICFHLCAYKKGFKYSGYFLGLVYTKQRDYVSAEKYLVSAVNDEISGASLNLATLYEIQNMHDSAERYYLLAVEDNDLNAMNRLANLYFAQKKFDLSEKYLLKAMKEGDVSAINGLANLYVLEKKNAMAEEYFLRAIEKGSIEAMANIGAFYAEQKMYEKAEQWFKTAMENDNVEAIGALGVLYNDLKKYQEAEKYFLLAIEKGNKDALTGLARHYFNLNKFNNAEKYYQLAADNGTIEAKLYLSVIYYFSTKNKSEALELLMEWKNADMSNGSMIPFEIMVKTWNGKVDEVADELRTLIQNKRYEILPQTFEHLLYHYQVNMVRELFESPEFGETLREQYQPIYYAVRLLTGNEPNLRLKIPPEIEQAVDDILTDVEKGRKLYYGGDKDVEE